MHEDEIEVVVTKYEPSVFSSLWQATYNFIDGVQRQLSLLERQRPENPWPDMVANDRVEASKYEVDEVELSFGVNASGSIALIAKLEAGAQAAIKVKLKRRPQNPLEQ